MSIRDDVKLSEVTWLAQSNQVYCEQTGKTVAVIPGARCSDPITDEIRLIAAAPELLAACKLALERHALDHNGFVKQTVVNAIHKATNEH